MSIDHKSARESRAPRRPGGFPVIELQAKRNSLHPWIFRKMISGPRRPVDPGAFVRIVARDGEFIGWGIYSPNGSLAIRVVSERESESPGPEFFHARLKSARALREDILGIHKFADAYRLIHGESDGLSGLIIDKYADLFIIEPYSAGYVRAIDWIAEALRDLYPSCRVALRPDQHQAAREGVERECAELARSYAPPDTVAIRENGIRMSVDFRGGHKTGYFIDQRDNRSAIAQFAAGKSVLDLFCYTGAFSLSAAVAGAARVTGVDLDEGALKTAALNARENGVKPEFIHANVYDCLRARVKNGETSDIVILDPSKLAGVRDEIPKAKRAYGDLNRLAMKSVAPGGILLSCSCSGLISEPDFLSILTHAANEAGVTLQIFRVAGASSDHPFLTNFPEGRYLKAVFARVLPGNGRRIFSEDQINPKPK